MLPLRDELYQRIPELTRIARYQVTGNVSHGETHFFLGHNKVELHIKHTFPFDRIGRLTG